MWCVHVLEPRPQFHDKTLIEIRKNEICGGRRKKARNLGPPPFGAQHSGPNPTCLFSSSCFHCFLFVPFFSMFSSLCFCFFVSHSFFCARPVGRGQSGLRPKWVAAKVDRGQSRKCLLPKKVAPPASPQLLPDFIDREHHLDVAKPIIHPVMLPPVLFQPARYAIEHQPQDRRSNGVRLCVKLCELLQDQPLMKALVLCQHVLALTKTVLQAGGPVRNVPFVREISDIIENVDSSLWPDNVLGLPTVGWALHAPTKSQLDHLASSTIQDLLANVEIKNKRVISRTRPSSDPVFDEEAWSKTKEQIAMNVSTQQVDDSSEISFPQLCLVRRHGKWDNLVKP